MPSTIAVTASVLPLLTVTGPLEVSVFESVRVPALTVFYPEN